MKHLLLIIIIGLYPSLFFSQIILPNTISGLTLWLSGDSANIINGKVVSWYDKSGNNNSAIQLDTLKQPILALNNLEINNQPSVRFDGINDYLQFSDITDIKTSIFVFNHNPTYKVYDNLIGHTTNASGSLLSGGLYKLIYYSPNWLNIAFENSVSVSPYSLAQDSIYKIITLMPSPNGVANTISHNGYQGYNSWHGNIAEILFYNKVLSPSELTIIENYLNSKYAPPISLPANFSITNSFCDTTIIPLGKYTNYHWSTGATTPTISVNKSGKYWVNATNIFGKVSSDTIEVSYPDYSFKDSTFCSGNIITWNTQLPKSQFSFLWSDSSTDSLLNINQSGQYHVKITDGFGCFVESDTVTATMDSFSSIASLGPDTNLCAGNAIYLKSGTQPGLTYLWNDNSTNDSLYINTSGQYSAIITNTNYCIAKDTINVTVIGQAPTASFINSIACKNNSISFTDNSTPPSGNTISSWFWNFGDGTTLADTSVIQNPFYTYADTGNYLINLSVTTNAGCKQLFVKNVHVAPKPVANFSNIMACQNDSAQFNNLSTTVTGYSPLSYSWNFGDPSSGAANTSTLTSPKHLFSQQINYSVKLIATNNAGCKDSLTKNILVKAQVKADFTYNTPCVKIPITFTDNSIVPLPDNLNTRLWTIGTSTSTGLSATKSFTASGIYPVTLKVTGFNGCISTITKQIDVKQSPIAQFTLSSICYKDTGTAIDQSIAQNGTLTSWNWKLNDVTFSTAPIATLSPLATTSYSVKLTVTNSFNCRDSITKAFTVYPLPAVDFTTSPAIYYYPNSPIAFAPTTTGGVLYNWNINNTSYSILSPTVTFPAAGTYTASLSIKNAFGCNNTKTKTLSVIDYLVDLAVLDVRTDKSSDQYITIQTDLGNMGSAAISQFEISYQIADAATVKETWQGNLNPGGFLTYTFNSKAIQENPDQIYITCVNLGLVNSIIDFNVNNNTLCAPSDLSEIKVYDPYPNPSDEKTTLSIILPADMEINLDIVDELGQDIFMNKTVSGKQGLNLVTIPTTDLSKAAYIVKITIGDKIFIKKILKAKR